MGGGGAVVAIAVCVCVCVCAYMRVCTKTHTCALAPVMAYAAFSEAPLAACYSIAFVKCTHTHTTLT